MHDLCVDDDDDDDGGFIISFQFFPICQYNCVNCFQFINGFVENIDMEKYEKFRRR